ncbi:hypothetical protein ACVCE4_06110 [Klebsiella pneumoniae]
MGNGTRILLNADGIITDWAKQHFEPVSSPLSAIANPKVAFDLLTPVDNSALLQIVGGDKLIIPFC